MKSWYFARYAFGIVTTTSVLAGCAGGGAGPSTPHVSAASQRSAFNAGHYPPPNLRTIEMLGRAGVAPMRYPNRAKSWMLPDVRKHWLLYASDAYTSTVDVYGYQNKAGKLVGQITGFTLPEGQCIDASGNVYIVDNYTSIVYEFAHGGTTPIASVHDAYGHPIGCSIDRTTGNVAVANSYGFNGASGGIEVFAGGLGGAQTFYTDPNLFWMWPPGYDPNGNLFVEGGTPSANGFAELPKGSATFIELSGLHLGRPGGVQWDGHYLAASDEYYHGTTAIYRVTISGSSVSVVRTTELADDECGSVDTFQPFIGGVTRKRNTVVAGNIYCNSRFGFWNYAEGGNPKRILPAEIAPENSWGQSISPPHNR